MRPRGRYSIGSPFFARPEAGRAGWDSKHTDSGDPVFGGGRARVIAAGHPLLAAAQHAGEARGDLNIEQVLDLIHAIATIDGDTSYVQPIFQAALDGLRAGG